MAPSPRHENTVKRVKVLLKELGHDVLEEAFKKSGAGFQTAAKVAESRRKVLMAKKFFGSIFAVNSNNGRVKDFDFELVLESDRIVEVSSRAVNVVKMPMEALSK